VQIIRYRRGADNGATIRPPRRTVVTCAHRSWRITVFVLLDDRRARRFGASHAASQKGWRALRVHRHSAARVSVTQPPVACIRRSPRRRKGPRSTARTVAGTSGCSPAIPVPGSAGPGRAAADDLGDQRRARGVRGDPGRCLPLNTSGSPRRHSAEWRHRCASKYTVISLPWCAFPGHGAAEGDPGSASDADMGSG